MCSRSFEMSLYTFVGLIEVRDINVNFLLQQLNTINLINNYIRLTLCEYENIFAFFSRINISKSLFDIKNLSQLLSHIISWRFEEALEESCKVFRSLSFFRYQNNLVVSSADVEDLNCFLLISQSILKDIGLHYNLKTSRILTKQQTIKFVGFEISPKFLLVQRTIYNQVILNAAKEEKKLILSKIRYILRSRHEDGKTRAKTNMPLSKAISLINPLIINWRIYYLGLVPSSTLDALDWLLNEKIYRWYIKRLKKNRVTHWNKRCIQIVHNKKRIAQDAYLLELFNSSLL
nr:mat1b [Erythrocladia irregularis]